MSQKSSLPQITRFVSGALPPDRPFLPFDYGLLVDPKALRQIRQALLAMLCRSTECLRRFVASV